MMATLDELDPDNRDSIMVLSYVLLQVQQLNWTADRLAEGLASTLRVEDVEPDPGEEPLGALTRALGESEQQLLALSRVQVLRRALLTWASLWEDDDEGALMGDVREFAEALLQDEDRNYMQSILTLIKGGRDDGI